MNPTEQASQNPRLVAFDEFTDGIHVSSVLLTSGDGFETMVFDRKGQGIHCLQTLSREEAVRNHAEVCRAIAMECELPPETNLNL